MLKQIAFVSCLAVLSAGTTGFAQESSRSTIEKGHAIRMFWEKGGWIAATSVGFAVGFGVARWVAHSATVSANEAIRMVLQGEIAARAGLTSPNDIVVKSWWFKDEGVTRTGSVTSARTVEVSYARKIYGLPGAVTEGAAQRTLLPFSMIGRLSERAGRFTKIANGSAFLAGAAVTLALINIVRGILAIANDEPLEVSADDVRAEKLRRFFALESDADGEVSPALAVLASDPEVQEAVAWTYAVMEAGTAELRG